MAQLMLIIPQNGTNSKGADMEILIVIAPVIVLMVIQYRGD